MSPPRSKNQRLGAALSHRPATPALRLARRLIVLVVGGTLLIVGVVLFFTPGPGLLVVPLGLSVLAAEFVWARRLLVQVKGALRTGRAALQRAGLRVRWERRVNRPPVPQRFLAEKPEAEPVLAAVSLHPTVCADSELRR